MTRKDYIAIADALRAAYPADLDDLVQLCALYRLATGTLTS